MRQEKRNKVMLGVLVLLLLAAAAILSFDQRGGKIDGDVFKIENLSKIDSISLVGPNGAIRLSFDGVRWKVNDSYTADDQLITVFFATLQQVKPKRLVAQNEKNKIEQFAGVGGVNVSLYEAGSLVRQFEVVGNDKKSETYFTRDDQESYVMTIPGYRVYVAGIFELDESGWRDKRIFNFNWRNFKKLVARFPAEPSKGFEVEDMGSGFQIMSLAKTDTVKLNDYLDNISLLIAQKILGKDHQIQYDSLVSIDPTVIIDVFDVGDRFIRLELFKPIENAEILGKWNSTEFVLLDRRQLVPLTRSRDYFMPRVP